VAYTRQRAGVRWAREEALPEIRRLSESGLSGWGAAFRLAERAQAVLPDDPELRRLLEAISAESEILTEPAGASVWVKAYEELASPWQLIGTTPIRGRRMPAAYFRWRIEKEGFVPLARVEWGASWDLSRGTVGPSRHHWVLDREGALPPDMVRVEGGDGLPDFLADRNEVTNRAFKAFIDAGGYRDRRYWTHAFEKDGRTLSWEEALRLLVDRSGQPGPAGWEAGDYPDGDDDLPVGGVSWYEAAAYAEFAGKSLPTVRHWWVATGQYYARTADFMGLLLLPISNFAGRGPMAVGTSEALSPFGTADMAGNVREWCWNVSELGRSVRGGAWNDQVYMYMYVTQAAPFDRSEKNGFRCVRYPDPSRTPREAFAPLARGAVRDFSREKPVPAEVFAAYRERFSYDPTDLAAKVEARNESSPDWIEETVSFSAAYGGERVRGRLFLPRTGRPPFQAVLYCPGFSAQLSTNSDLIVDRIEFKENLAFLVKGGRAVLYPVYKGTYERGIGASFAPDEGTRSFAAWMVQLVQDARRSVDYLQSRPDIDGTRVAFYGFSFGGRWANLVLAVEDRFKAAIVHSGGLRSTQHPRPDVDLFNFAPRVRTPVLMLHGRYDLAVPLQTEALPMFRLLGTPTDDKHLIVVDTDHWIPRPVLIRESLAWLDKYLGPVETATAAGAEPPVGAQPTPNP
jgi:dienelactone hydrolase